MTAETLSGAMDGTATVSIVSGGTAPYTYLWDDPSSQTTSTATGLAGNTTYTVIVTDANGCIKTFLVFVAGATTDIDEFSEGVDKIKLFPNPGFNITTLHFNLDKASTVCINIVNVLGEIITNEQKILGIGEQNLLINLQELQAGVYYITTTIESKIYTNKLIVAH